MTLANSRLGKQLNSWMVMPGPGEEGEAEWQRLVGGREIQIQESTSNKPFTKLNPIHKKEHENLELMRNNQPTRDFPGCPVAKTPGFQCRGLRFHPWSGN